MTPIQNVHRKLATKGFIHTAVKHGSNWIFPPSHVTPIVCLIYPWGEKRKAKQHNTTKTKNKKKHLYISKPI